jgi:hypothetical protein
VSLRFFYDQQNWTTVPHYTFYQQVAAKIRRLDPQGVDKVLNEVTCWLDAIVGTGNVTSVTFQAGLDWSQTDHQVIFDATNDFDQSRWWLGLALVEAAINHDEPFYCYRPDAFTKEGLLGLSYWWDQQASVITQSGRLGFHSTARQHRAANGITARY